MREKADVKAIPWLDVIWAKARDYQQLFKLRLSLTVVFSSWMAFLIASPSEIFWMDSLLLILGGFGITGAANVLNQVFEKDFDRYMRRTADRPLAEGRMALSEAILIAGFLAVFGIVLLAVLHPLASFFGTLAMLLYAFVYTPLKRVGPSAVVVGAVAGALPTFIGALAAQGEITALALILFAVQFFWQFPHFLAIGFLGYTDYRKAGYLLVPYGDSELAHRSIGIQSIWYAFLLVLISGMPFGQGYTGPISFGIILVLSIGYLVMSIQFYRKFDRASALKLMFYSFTYIPITLISLFLDKL